MKTSELIAELQAHQAEYGDTDVEFRAWYGVSESRGTAVIPAPEKVHGPWPERAHGPWHARDDRYTLTRAQFGREVKAWEEAGRPFLIWTNICTG